MCREPASVLGVNEMEQSILYLDDDMSCLRVFQETFNKDYEVRIATTPAEAHALLSARPADIVVSDQLMPEIKGTEFLRQVAALYPASYRVLLTGGVGVGNVVREVGTGIVHLFVPKPWTEQSIRQMLERAGIRRNGFEL
jgi:DNA-binding NtrC family response regulator